MNFNIDFVANQMARKKGHRKVNIEVLREFVGLVADVEKGREGRVVVSAFRKIAVSRRPRV